MFNGIRNLKKRYPVATGIIVGCFLAAGAAAAAWIIFSGASGTATDTVGTPSTVNAINILPTTGSTTVQPGTDGTVKAEVGNQDGNLSHSLTSLSASSIVAANNCDTSAISFTPDPGIIGHVFPPSFDGTMTIGTLHAGANLDPACAGTTLTLTLTGTTTP